MAIYARNGIYWLDVSHRGKRLRKSLNTTDPRTAELAASEIERSFRLFHGTTNPIKKFDAARRLGKIKERAESAGMECTLTTEKIREMIEKSRGVCALTGVAFSYERPDGASKAPFSPSIDRIDNRKGYTEDNCRVVCHAVNVAINEWGEDVFAHLARAYVRLHG